MGTRMLESGTISNRFYQADELGLCPECGATMNEVDRATEAEWIYIWLECSKSVCDGRWLQKRPDNGVGGV